MLLNPKNTTKITFAVNAFIMVVWLIVAIYAASTKNSLMLWIAIPFVLLGFMGLVFSAHALLSQKKARL